MMNGSELQALEMRCLFHDQLLFLTDQIVQGDFQGRKHETYRFKGACGCRVTFERGAGPPGGISEKQIQAGLKMLQSAQLDLRKENDDGSS